MNIRRYVLDSAKLAHEKYHVLAEFGITNFEINESILYF